MGKGIICLTAFLFLSLLAAAACLPSTRELGNSAIFIGSFPTTVNGETKAKFLRLIPDRESWEKALFHCRQTYDGELVSIEDEDDDKLIQDTLIVNSITKAWISGHYEGGWRWGAGALMNYTNFGPAYPGSTEYAVYASASGLLTYEWRTAPKISTFPYICQSIP